MRSYYKTSSELQEQYNVVFQHFAFNRRNEMVNSKGSDIAVILIISQAHTGTSITIATKLVKVKKYLYFVFIDLLGIDVGIFIIKRWFSLL